MPKHRIKYQSMKLFNIIIALILNVIDAFLGSLPGIEKPTPSEIQIKMQDPCPDVAQGSPQDSVEVDENEPGITITFPHTIKDQTHKYFWIIDPGHGEDTPGKRSPDSELMEWKFNRDIARRIIAQFNKNNLYGCLTVEGNHDMRLETRVQLANELFTNLPKRFISIHGNASAADGNWHSPHGIETWHFHGSDSGRQMAAIFQRNLVDFIGWRDRGIRSKPEKQFYVLRKTDMTAILTENGFYDNKAQKAEMMLNHVREDIATAHIMAILEYEKTVAP